MEHILYPTTGNSSKRQADAPSARREEARSAALGNTTPFAAPPVNTGLQPSVRTILDEQTGEILDFELSAKEFKRAFSHSRFRSKKYALQATAKELLSGVSHHDNPRKKFRIGVCLRNVISPSKTVSIYKSIEHGSCHYHGLAVCASVWTCPICASKITEKKSQIVKSLINKHKLAGGDVLLLTFTTPHTRKDKLSDLLYAFKKAEEGFSITKPVKTIKKNIGFIAPIKSLEITFGHANGWHPHSHQLWFVDSGVDINDLKKSLFPHYQRYCIKKGLESPSFKHGLDIVGGLNAAGYITKMGWKAALDDEDAKSVRKHWSAASEVTKGHTKSARGDNFAPFDLLEVYLDKKADWAKSRFIEYAQATIRTHYISRFKPLKDLYPDAEEDVTEEEAARGNDDPSYFLGYLEYDEWRKILHHEQRSSILTIAEEQGFIQVKDFIRGLPDIPDYSS